MKDEGMKKVEKAKETSNAMAQSPEMVYGDMPKNKSPLETFRAFGAVQEGDKQLKMPKRKELFPKD